MPQEVDRALENYTRQIIYNNLERLKELSKNTVLCINPGNKKLYVAKKMPLSAGLGLKRLLHHENGHIPKILWVEENGADNTAEVVTEYVAGTVLSELIKNGRTLEAERALEILGDVAKGLTELHRMGLIHRDVTPKNIIIVPGGNAVLIDFGIIRAFDGGKSSDTQILGTPGYAAPEQFGFTESDSRTDIYACGVLLNVLLTGKLPGEAVPEGKAGRIIKKCTEIDASKRYDDINALLQDIDRDFRKIYRKWWFWVIIICAFSLVYYWLECLGIIPG